MASGYAVLYPDSLSAHIYHGNSPNVCNPVNRLAGKYMPFVGQLDNGHPNRVSTSANGRHSCYHASSYM